MPGPRIPISEFLLPSLGCWVFFGGLLCCSIYGIHSSTGNLKQSTGWAESQDWRLATCKVLATGVSCVQSDTNTSCGDFGADGLIEKMEGEGTVAFDYKSQAVCPGAYWCATEGDECKCDGKVTYAPELFNGNGYTPDNESTVFSVMVSGSITCGTNEKGLPFDDPRPYWIKHCWCMPRAIYDRTQQHREPFRSPYQCALEVQQDLQELHDQRPRTTSARRLDGVPPVPTSVAKEDADVDDWIDETEESTEEKWLEGEQLARRLSTHSSVRRRRTFYYTPWALVEVPSQDDSGVGGKANEEKVLACAYEFGAPVLTYGDYRSDGPYGSWYLTGNFQGMSLAEEAASKAQAWAKGSANNCWVRTVGQSAQDTCSVSMEPLESLIDRRHGDLNRNYRNMRISEVGLIVLTLFCCCAVCCKSEIAASSGSSLPYVALEE